MLQDNHTLCLEVGERVGELAAHIGLQLLA